MRRSNSRAATSKGVTIMLTRLLATSLAVVGFSAYGQQSPSIRIEAEEDVYSFVNPDNGSGPMWSYGCTTIVRLGDRVFVSEMETGEGVPRLCNTRWRLAERIDGGWDVFAEAEGYRQREPAILATLSDTEFFLNVNDSIMPPGTEYGRCVPKLLAFDTGHLESPSAVFEPTWVGETDFTDHSYRGYAADRKNRQLLMLNINAGNSTEHYALLNDEGETLKSGGIDFPIRSCYPQVALKDGAAYVLAVTDIREPNDEWQAYKYEQTGQKWDYVFRILYFTQTSDVANQPFSEPLEIANVDKTGGHIGNQDLWISPEGEAYILYTEVETASPLIRDKFVPDGSLIPSLKLAIVKDGKVVERRVLIEGTETIRPGWSRFQVTPDGKVYAMLIVGGMEQNQLMQIYPLEEKPDMVPVPFKTPFSSFFLASERAGNLPSNTLDVYGHRDSGTTLSYARVVIE